MGTGKIKKALLMLAVLLALCSCGQWNAAAPSAAASQPSSEAPSVSSIAGVASQSTPSTRASTSETASPWLEDYDAFWAIVEENYPLYNAAQRITGNDLGEVKETYRPNASQTQYAGGLYRILEKCAQAFDGTGHFTLFHTTDAYRSSAILYGRLAEDSPKCAYLYNQLNNPASIAYYGFDPAPELQKVLETSGNEPGTRSNGNLTFKDYPDDKTAYAAIARMTSVFDNNDSKVLEDWFRSLEAKGYKDCILDIRGNGGGSSNYWSDYIAAPNLKQEYTVTNYGLVKGAACIEYWQAAGRALKPIDTLPVETLHALHKGDLEGITHFLEYTKDWKPQGEPLYSGRFWLLVDKRVYSSSEMLAAFCKDTGFATLVGTTTGGDGIGEDPLLLALPNSGICFRFTAEGGLNADGSCNEEVGTQPDIAIQPGEDALEVCLASIRAAK